MSSNKTLGEVKAFYSNRSSFYDVNYVAETDVKTLLETVTLPGTQIRKLGDSEAFPTHSLGLYADALLPACSNELCRSSVSIMCQGTQVLASRQQKTVIVLYHISDDKKMFTIWWLEAQI